MKSAVFRICSLALVLLQSSIVVSKVTIVTACNVVSTVFISLPPITVTETVISVSNEVDQADSPETTIFHTIGETRVISVEEVTHAPSALGGSAKSTAGTAHPYTGIGLGGWNTSYHANHSSPASTATVPSARSNLGTTLVKRLKARDVSPEWITATIEGKIVSWENNYSPAEAEPASTTTILTSSAILSSSDVTTQTPTSQTVASTSIIASTNPVADEAVSTSTVATPSKADPIPSCKSSSPPFIIDFDDLPHFIITSTPSDENIPPIPSPYRKLHFDSHFGYVPPPSDPYPPHSPPQLAVYRAAGTARDGSSPSTTLIDDGLEIPGEFGAGPRAELNAFWINPLSGFFGCADGSDEPCILTIKGYIGSGPKQPSVAQVVVVAPCPGLSGCQLVEVDLRFDFRGLTGMQIYAAVGDKAVDYYLDDLKVEWYDSTCAAQAIRASFE